MRLGVLVLGVALTGCAANEDPAQGGLFSGISGISSGSYEARQGALEAEVGAEAETEAALKARLAELELEVERARAELTAARDAAVRRRAVVPPDLAEEARVALAEPETEEPDEATRISLLEDSVERLTGLTEALAGL